MGANQPDGNTPSASSPGWGRWVTLGLLMIALVATFAMAFYRPKAAAPSHVQVDLATVLAPFVAIATAIERFWEFVFNWYESIALATARLIGVSAQAAEWMITELNNARGAVTTAVTNLGDNAGAPDKYQDLQTAEARLQDAETRIAELLKSPGYVAFKSAITLLGSLVIGLIISVSSRLQLLHMAGFTGVDFTVDILVTGLLIGAGPGPLHQFIGLLQEFKNTAAGLADLARGGAIKKAADALHSAAGSVTTTQPAANRIGGAPAGRAVAAASEGQTVSVTVSSPAIVGSELTPGEALGIQRLTERMLGRP